MLRNTLTLIVASSSAVFATGDRSFPQPPWSQPTFEPTWEPTWEWTMPTFEPTSQCYHECVKQGERWQPNATKDPLTLEACPQDNLSCRQEGASCGYISSTATIALCDQSFVCQSAEVIPATEITARYIGTCVLECAAGHIQVEYGLCAPVCQIENPDIPDTQWVWANHEETVVVDECNNKCKCDATEGRFVCPNEAPCKPSTPVCRDISGWTDSKGNSCEWYESDAVNCMAFGSNRAGSDGRAANQACCVCGGGRSANSEGKFQMQKACPLAGSFLPEGQVFAVDPCGSTSECTKEGDNYGWTYTRGEFCPKNCEDRMDVIDGAELEWRDENMNTCSWYALEPTRCLYDYSGLMGAYTPAQACCACGGTEAAPQDSSSESDSTMTIVMGALFGVAFVALCIVTYSWRKRGAELTRYRSMEGHRALA